MSLVPAICIICVARKESGASALGLKNIHCLGSYYHEEFNFRSIVALPTIAASYSIGLKETCFQTEPGKVKWCVCERTP